MAKVNMEKTVETPEQGDGSQHPHEATRAQEAYIKPPVDIHETQGGLVVVADLPGVAKENLNVEVEDDVLTIQARAEHAVPGEPIHREFELVSFYRQFQLSNEVDSERISADFKHGVLTLNLPKAEKAKPKQIQVQVE